MSDGVPVIDISPWLAGDAAGRRAVACQVDDACREWGFLIIVGHGVSADEVTAMERAAWAFFDLSLSERLACELPPQPGRRGYQRFATGVNGRLLGRDAPPDLRESFRMGPEAVAGDPYYDSQEMRGFFKPNVWPQAAPEMRAVWERYYAAMGVLALQLMQIFAEALELPRNWFDDKLSRPASQLVAQHYPALESAPPPDQFRNHAHTDFGNLTILKSEDRPNGLQVLGRDEVWHEVVPVPGTFIVNIGDMLAQWTNDRWHSTMHRVANPPDDERTRARRLSVVFFHEPSPNALIDAVPSCVSAEWPKKYAPIRAGEYMAKKLDLVQDYVTSA